VKRMLVGLLVLGLLVAGTAVAVVAQEEPDPGTLALFESPIPPPEEWPPVPDVDVGGIEGFLAALGISGVIATVIEILKVLGAVNDGAAGRWATIANVVVFAVLVILGVFGVDYAGDSAKMVYDLLYRVGQIVLSILGSPIFFWLMRQAGVFLPLPGRSQ